MKRGFFVYDVIALGSASIDVFVKTKAPEIVKNEQHDDVCYAIGQKILVKDMHVDTGSGGTNVAVALSRLGLKTGWIGKLGSDLNAKSVLDKMKREHVDFLGTFGKGMTGYSVILTGLEQDRTILTFKGVNDQLEPREIRWNKLKTRWFYFSAMINRSFETLQRAAILAKKKGVKYAFNPSAYLAQKGLKALKPIIQGCNLLVLNLEEAQALLGTKAGSEDMLPELQEYAEIVLITDGARVVHASDGVNSYRIFPPKIKVEDTTGAGDAFAAGVLAGLIIKQEIRAAIQWAIAESSSVIQHLGAKKGLLTCKEIERWVKAKPVKIKRF